MSRTDDSALTAEQLEITGDGGDRDRGVPRPAAGRRAARRRGGDPPHARLGPRPPRRSPAASPSSATTRSAPTCYWREAPGAAPDDASAAVRAKGGVPDEPAGRRRGRRGGVPARAADLERQGRRASATARADGRACSRRATSTWTRRSTATARSSPGTPPAGCPLKVTNLVDQLPDLRCPLLGLFGNEDQYPEPGARGRARPDPHRRSASRTSSTGTTTRGTRFFAVDRPSYRVAGGQRRLGADRDVLRHLPRGG